MNKLLYILIVVGFVAGILSFIYRGELAKDPVACTQEAMICPDGSSVGREGPKCEFTPCPDVNQVIESKKDLIILENIIPYSLISPGFVVKGKARGSWFFEGSFPVLITDEVGLLRNDVIATAEGDWMTEDFVPFSVTLEYSDLYMKGNPYYKKGDEIFDKGILIFQKDNPSGLSEHDDSLRIPIRFSPSPTTIPNGEDFSGLNPSEPDKNRDEDLGNGGIACTEDAKVCPDGSYVGRTGPKCEFAPCPSNGQTGTEPGSNW